MTDTHVALISSWNRPGGIASYSARFAEALQETGARCTVVPIENSDSANPLEFVSLISEVPTDADVIHVQFEAGLFGQLGMTGVGAPAFFLALARSDKPVVTTLHEVHSEHLHGGRVGDRLLRSRDFTIERLALRTSDAIVVHTGQARTILQERHSENHHVERMLHPADESAEQLPQEEAKEELGFEGPTLLTFGFVEEKKRYQDVIRVLPELPDVTYVIAGGYRGDDGKDHANECLELAAELEVEDRIRFTGYVDDGEVPILFSAADAVVLPYERVSQSGVVNDALAYRRPVVASSLSAFEELRSEFDCLLTYDRQSELNEQVSASLYDGEIQACLRRRADEYVNAVSWERFADQSLNLYRDL